MPGGYPVRKTGIYTREPCSPSCCARRDGSATRLVPYEPNERGRQTQQQRETGQAGADRRPFWRKIGDAKVLVHAGYAHIGEAQEGLPDDARPMAMELAKMSGLPLLTIDQTSTRSYEAADIDTVGQRLAKQFAVNVPSVLVSRDGGEAWSYRPGPQRRVRAFRRSGACREAQRPDWPHWAASDWRSPST